MKSDLDLQSVEALFSNAMQGRDFRKKGLIWSIERDVIVVILNLQTSSWNERKGWGRHYLNISAFIRALDPTYAFAAKVPPHYRGHVKLRAGHLMRGEYVDDLTCFDDTVGMETKARRQAIDALLADYVLPAVGKLSSADGIRKLADAGKLPGNVFPSYVADWVNSQTG